MNNTQSSEGLFNKNKHNKTNTPISGPIWKTANETFDNLVKQFILHIEKSCNEINKKIKFYYHKTDDAFLIRWQYCTDVYKDRYSKQANDDFVNICWYSQMFANVKLIVDGFTYYVHVMPNFGPTRYDTDLMKNRICINFMLDTEEQDKDSIILEDQKFFVDNKDFKPYIVSTKKQSREHFGFNDDDLIFLFGKNKNKAMKSLEALSKTHPEYTDYEALDHLSKGHGREAYVKLSNHRIKSAEYMNAFEIVNNKKTFDLSTADGKARHIDRNKNQYGKAPKDLKTMYEFVERGYFINEGYSPCHNLTEDTEPNRKASVSRMLYLVSHKLMHDKKEAGLGNISFRGTPGSSFEGCQFIYNEKSGKLVTDSMNRGTWDYGKFGTPSHYMFDIIPWLSIGNGSNNETPEMFIMSHKDEQMYLKTTCNKIKECIENDLGTATAKAIKEGMSSEAIAINPEFILKERKQKYLKSVEEVCSNFVERCDEMPLSFLDSDWNNYISFCTSVDDKSLISGLEMFVNSMDSDPTHLKELITDSNKSKYKEFLLKSSFICLKDGTLKADAVVKNDMPITLKVNLNKGFVERLQNCSSQDAAIKEFHKIRDELIIPTISERLGKISFKCRVLDDVVDTKDSFESFILTVSQLRTISKEEEILVTNAQNKIKPEEEFAKEELNTYYEPEYSTEGVISGTILAIGISTLVLGVIGVIVYLFDKLLWSKNRKIIQIISDNINIIEEPILVDYAKYTALYNKAMKESSFINGLYTIDKYGKYQFTTENSDFSKDSFLRVDETTFAQDIINKLYYAFKEMKNKNPKEIKSIFDNIQYSYVLAEGKPLLELLNEFNRKSSRVYDPITGKYRDDVNERTKDSLLIEMGAIKSSYKSIKKLIISECGKMARKGFDIRPAFFVNGQTIFNDDIFTSNKPYKLEDVKVAFYLCMHTSITYGSFMKIKEIVETELAKDSKK